MANTLMRPILVISVLLLVNACGTTPKKTLEEAGHQYCTTQKVMVTTNGILEEVKVTECNDDNVKKLMPPKMGVGKNCREFWYTIYLDNQEARRRGYACLFKGKDYEHSKWYIVKYPF